MAGGNPPPESESVPAWTPPQTVVPAGPAPGVTFGGFWIRFLAYVLDVLIVSLGLLPLLVLLWLHLDAFYYLGALALSIGYYAWSWARSGSTPAMALFGLRVVRDADGGAVGWGKALVRYVGLIVSALVLYIGLIWVAFDQRKRGWHDLMAGTVVIRTDAARSRGGRRGLTYAAAAAGCLIYVIGVVAFIAFGAIFVASLFSTGIRDSSGAITTSQIVSANALRVGDCFNVPDGDTSSVLLVNAEPCSSPHVYEVFFVGDLPDGAFPGADAIGTWADQRCSPAFEAYVGVSYSDSMWYAFYISPSEDTWSAGDRRVLCQLHNEGETPVTGSARDTGT